LAKNYAAKMDGDKMNHRTRTRIVVAAIAIGLLLAVSSCVTVNKFDEYQVEGTDLAADMRVPPEPEIESDYFVTIDNDNPIGTVLSVGTTIAKASEVNRATDRMREALDIVDVPGIVFEQTFVGAAQALEARMVEDRRSADLFLDIEIREYGISAGSSGGHVALEIKVQARLVHVPTGELIWRRNINRDDEASPYMFGVGGSAGNVVTAAVLSEMTTEEMAQGFERLANSLAREIAREMEDDLYDARYGK
jgi:hypothetical protein